MNTRYCVPSLQRRAHSSSSGNGMERISWRSLMPRNGPRNTVLKDCDWWGDLRSPCQIFKYGRTRRFEVRLTKEREREGEKERKLTVRVAPLCASSLTDVTTALLGRVNGSSQESPAGRIWRKRGLADRNGLRCQAKEDWLGGGISRKDDRCFVDSQN